MNTYQKEEPCALGKDSNIYAACCNLEENTILNNIMDSETEFQFCSFVLVLVD